MWTFTIKTEGTFKARLVGRGDLMIPFVDFNPNKTYCGNVSSTSIKVAITIAAKYKLTMRRGDLEGAYLVTRGDKTYPVFIKTPEGYYIPPGMCIQAVGNCYGFPMSGRTFSIELDGIQIVWLQEPDTADVLDASRMMSLLSLEYPQME